MPVSVSDLVLRELGVHAPGAGLEAFAEDEDPTKVKGSCERHPIGAGQREGPADIAAQVEDREALGTGVPCEERIAGPGGDAGQLRELARPLTLPAPGRCVDARGVKDAQFVGALIGNDEAAIGEPHGVPDTVEEVGRVALPGPDVQGRLRGNPAEAGAVGRPSGWPPSSS